MLKCFLDGNDDALWFVGRSYFLGIDGRAVDHKVAYEYIRDSKHPDAIWLCGLFAKYGLPCFEMYDWLEKVKKSEGPDKRLMTYKAVWKGVPLKCMKPARLGEPLAMAIYAFEIRDFKMITSVLEQGDKHAIDLYLDRCSHLLTDEKLIELYTRSALLGSGSSCKRLANYFLKIIPIDEEKVFHYMTRAVVFSDAYYYREICKFVDDFLVCGYYTNSGKYLCGKMMNILDSFHYNPMNICVSKGDVISFYEHNNIQTYIAVDWWLLIALHINTAAARVLVNTDIRKKIGILIWNTRRQGLFNFKKK